MGVSSSTIILYDENKGRLKVHTTNITNRKELIILMTILTAKNF